MPLLLFDLMKVFDYMESSQKSDFYPKRSIFLSACGRGSELPYNIISKYHTVSTLFEIST